MDRPIPVMNWLLGCEHHLDSRREKGLDSDTEKHAESGRREAITRRDSVYGN